MPTGRQGSIRLFQFKGIDVFLHWTWFLAAIWVIRGDFGTYSSIGWNIAEYLALFLIVLTHEFGHALACRSVGGVANRIVLWPLGGVAYVDPPPRPGATLWSIAAGPLVNVVLFPALWGLFAFAQSENWAAQSPDLVVLLYYVARINAGLLFFNILPIFPLDGGQIVRALLWFAIGRARSLMVATVLGFLGGAAFVWYAFQRGSAWLAILAAFMLLNCWSAMKHSLTLLKMDRLPRRHGFSCPHCQNSPPLGEFWICGNCRHSFDTFATQGSCPFCGTQFPVTRCLYCGHASPMSQWAPQAPIIEGTVVANQA
jgi:Zn-dependent protease